MPGLLALVGGAEWRDGCSFDRTLLDEAGADEVVVLPTAAAYEHPDRAVARAEEWFAGLGAKVRALPVLRRPDALEEENVAAVRGARLVYLCGESSMHLRSVLKDSPLWDALVAQWHDGGAIAGSAAGAMALCDPMVDPRGGAFTLGLGLVDGLAVVPRADTWSDDKAHRTLQLAPHGLIVAAIDERTALLRDAKGAWRAEGAGQVAIWRDREPLDLTALP